MAISFIRIDDRVVHGQITTRWSKEFPCDGIVAVNDQIAKNLVLISAFKSAIDKSVFIFDYNTFLTKIDQLLKSPKQYFLICKEPIMMAKVLVDSGLDTKDVKTLIVGPQNDRPGTIEIGKNQSLLPVEGEALERIHQAGFEIKFALVPEVTAGTWASNRSKFGY